MRITVYAPEGELTGELLADVLSLVCVTVTPEGAGLWTRYEQLLAYDWAIREHHAASDLPVRRRPRPSFLPLRAAAVVSSQAAAPGDTGTILHPASTAKDTTP